MLEKYWPIFFISYMENIIKSLSYEDETKEDAAKRCRKNVLQSVKQLT